MLKFSVMPDPKEKIFVEYWEQHRQREKKFVYMALTGLPVGLLFSLPICFLLFTSRFWFKRADMVANAQLSPAVLIACVLMIALFVGVVYKRHQWEMKDQQYRELKSRMDRKS